MKSALPTPKKLPSGNWFIQIRTNGHSKSFTGPKKSQVIAEAAAYKYGQTEDKRPANITLATAINNYIGARSNVLSPSTIRGYRTIQRSRFQHLMTRKLSTITQKDWQEAVNIDAITLSAKTIQNSWRFILSVIKEETGQTPDIRLPQVVQSPQEFLNPEQIHVLIEAIHGDLAELAILYALHGLRRSELLAITDLDVDTTQGFIQVRGAMVPDENNVFIRKKETKNTASRRTVPILIPRLSELVQEQGAAITIHGATICNHLKSICQKASLPPVTVHGLRHSFASLAYHLGVPEKLTMAMGGWSNDATMKKIYTHIAETDLKNTATQMKNFFTSAK